MEITKRTSYFVGNTEIPSFLVGEYDGGKHWPESGDWDKWLAEKLDGFKANHVYIGHETYSTNSGGATLLIKGIRRGVLRGLIAGRICPECGWGKDAEKKCDDVACHLIDSHLWQYERALAWLRDKVEEAAFYEEA